MARRRMVRAEEPEKGQDEKPVFVPPEFDETEFLQTENRSAKMIYISLGIAVIAGILSYGIMTVLHLIGAGGKFIAPIAAPVLLVPVVLYLFHRFKIDLKALDWKKYLENGSMYLLTWFVIWMVSMNPPFSDFSAPLVSEPLMEVGTDSGNTVHYFEDSMFVNDEETEYRSIESIEGVTYVKLYFTITDNWDLQDKNISVQRMVTGVWEPMTNPSTQGLSIGKIGKNVSFDPPENVTDELEGSWFGDGAGSWEKNLYIVALDLNASGLDLAQGLELMVVVRVSDGADNEREMEYTFKIRPQ